LFQHYHFLHLVKFIFTVTDAALQELSLLIKLAYVMLKVLIVLFERIQIFLQVDRDLSFLNNFKSAYINFLHQVQLLLLVCNQLVIHIHQNAGIVEQFSVEHALFIQ